MIIYRLLGGYLFFGGIVSLVFILTRFEPVIYFTHLIPISFTVLVFLYFSISGLYGLIKPDSKTTTFLVKSTLLLQSFQFVAFGFLFKNYFGPYLALQISNRSAQSASLLFKPFQIWFANGLNSDSGEYTLFINFFPFILFIALEIEDEKRKRRSLQN